MKSDRIVMESSMRRPHLHHLLLLAAFLSPLVYPTLAERIQGFVSLDCGSVSSSDYSDPVTGLYWETDGGFGVAAASVSATATVDPPSSSSLLLSNAQLRSFRYFTGNNHTKYCYTLDEHTYGITFNETYLVRATFWAGTTSVGLPFPPDSLLDGFLRFQLLINADLWTNISIPIPQYTIVQKEVFVVAPSSSSISVCLSSPPSHSFHDTTPFISSLEIRQIPIDTDDISPLRLAMRPSPATSRAVHTVFRLDYGSPTGNSVRYPDDRYDRIWRGQSSTPQIRTTTSITGLSISNYVPLPVMQTAYTFDGYFFINISSAFLSGSSGGYAYSFYFAEISPNVTGPGQRIFNYAISTNTFDGPLRYRNNIDLYRVVGKYATYSTYSLPPYITLDDGDYIFLNFTRNVTSTFGPLISALELYNISDRDASSGTHDVDAAAVRGVTEAFPSALASWSGDPCLPYPYDWLRCASLDTDGTRIISLSLAHKGLSGAIPPAIANLTALQILDLQGNNFSGSIPTFLGSLPYLTTLLLQDNNLSGNIPSSLLEKVASHALNLSVQGNPYLDPCATSLDNSTSSNSCIAPTILSPNKARIKAILGGSIVSAIVVTMCIVYYLWKTICNENGECNDYHKCCNNWCNYCCDDGCGGVRCIICCSNVGS